MAGLGQWQHAPVGRLLLIAVIALIAATTVIWISIDRHYYGLSWAPGENDTVWLTRAPIDVPVPLPARVLGIQTDDRPITLTALDLIEEADVLDDAGALQRFLAQQEQLARQMARAHLTLLIADDQTPTREHAIVLTAQPSRPLGSLPLPFWIQLISGIGGFVIGGWILALRPTDAAARYFMLTGTGLLAASFAAAIYSTRELALPAALFRSLMIINLSGSAIFAFALAGLYLHFPQPLLSTPWRTLFAASFPLWIAAWVIGFAAGQPRIAYTSVLAASGLIVVLMAAQWRINRGKPQAIAALRWLGIASLVTIGAFVLLAALPAVYGTPPLLSQGTSFGFFLVLYVALAIGLRRHRLFELDRWAFRVLLWALAGLSLIIVDIALLTGLQWGFEPSLLISLLICAFAYLPLRNWLSARLISSPRPRIGTLFSDIIAIGLAPTASDYQKRWHQLLQRIFNPTQITPAADANTPEQIELEASGLHLRLPALPQVPACTLALADQGRRLFTPADAALSSELIRMLRYVQTNRDAWQRGAEEERARVAQDLHDDLGSRLLTGLYQRDLSQVHDTLGLAINDMRTIVRGLSGQALPLPQLLSELRHECISRARTAGLDVNWPDPEDPAADTITLEYRSYRHLLCIVRELFSNLIRHSGARHITITAHINASQQLCIDFKDDGTGFDGDGHRDGGHGLANINKRIDALCATLDYHAQPKGTLCALRIPLRNL